LLLGIYLIYRKCSSKPLMHPIMGDTDTSWLTFDYTGD
jgi:hypothetical protein